jgi:nitrate/nitrite-specific signal transduction histidine kinase
LRAGILEPVHGSVRALGFNPTVELRGPVETYSTDTINTELLAVVREALGNIARHAQATAAAITLDANAEAITLTVNDNGIGIGPDAVRGEGLNNLSRRAGRIGGTATVGPANTGGFSCGCPLTPTAQREQGHQRSLRIRVPAFIRRAAVRRLARAPAEASRGE